MTSEQPDTLDALYSGGMLTGKVILGVITVLLFCRYYEFVMSNIYRKEPTVCLCPPYIIW